MKTLLKLCALAIAFSVLLSMTTVSAFTNATQERALAVPTAYTDSSLVMGNGTVDELKEHIQTQINLYAESISLSKFKIVYTEENFEKLSSLIYDDIPLAFCANSYNCTIAGGYVTMLEPYYVASKSECEAMVDAVKSVAETLVFDIKGNDSLSDVEKALLLHDRIAVMCEYDLDLNSDYDEWCSRTAYGVLVERKAVCVGYAEAYMYLLELVGITSRSCRSLAMEHMWNIVTVDGDEYHVDITWDDTIWESTKWDIVGDVLHDSFLVSSQKLYASHPYSDYDTSPSSTKYDNYYWRNSETSVQFLNDKLYYFDNTNKKLVNATDNVTLLTLNDVWTASANSYWPSNYSRLSSDGKNLYYSSPSGIYKYFPETNSTRLVHSPALNSANYYHIYGFTIEDGYLVFDINNSPNFNKATMTRERVKIQEETPSISYSSGNECSATQELVVELSGDIIGYYWGTSENFSDNVYVSTQQSEIKLEISGEGTYYFTPVVGYGNFLDTYTVTYYKIILDTCGGASSEEYIITPNGSAPSLPTPTKDGYEFCGWYTDENYTISAEALNVASNQTFYAKWSIVGKIGDINNDKYITSLDAAMILRYDAALIEGDERLFAFGDVNADGSIDHLDACIVLKIDAGLIKG